MKCTSICILFHQYLITSLINVYTNGNTIKLFFLFHSKSAKMFVVCVTKLTVVSSNNIYMYMFLKKYILLEIIGLVWLYVLATFSQAFFLCLTSREDKSVEHVCLCISFYCVRWIANFIHISVWLTLILFII